MDRMYPRGYCRGSSSYYEPYVPSNFELKKAANSIGCRGCDYFHFTFSHQYRCKKLGRWLPRKGTVIPVWCLEEK